MGRNPKPLEIHALHGTRPQSAAKPIFQGGRPKYPLHLSPVARREFKKVVSLLEDRGTVTPGDEAIASVYAECKARWIQAKRELGDDLMVAITVADSHGVTRTVSRPNPLIKIVDACEARLLALTRELGLTPAAREKSKPVIPEEPKPELVPGSAAWLVAQDDGGVKQ